jgi:hypothetical protein
MNNSKLKSTFVILVIFASSIAGAYLMIDSVNPSPVRNSAVASLETEKAVLIINDPQKYAFFGLYSPTGFALETLNLLNRTILWASSQMNPDEVNLVFYSDPGNSHADFVLDWLVGGGYLPVNINNQTSANIEEFDPDYYLDTDLVIYWSTVDYDSTNVINSNVPFITVSVVQAEEMGIGSGIVTASGASDTFYIVNNGYYPTENYPLTKLVLDDSYSFHATRATSRGRVLVASQVESVTTEVETTTMENISIQGDGSALLALTITIPESPLSDMLREAFFQNPLSLEKNVEYDVPETIPVQQDSSIEDTVKGASLLGDVSDYDGQVELEDLDLITNHMGSSIGDDDWNPSLDLNWDGKIDMRDLAIAAHNYGKTDNNTGSLFISGYYDGELVNLTEVYYRGPEGSTKINVSASGQIWYHLLPGTYTIFGTFNGTEKSTDAVVIAGQVTYAQLDYGGTSAPQAQQNSSPVKQSLYEGVSMEQLILLGFDVNIYDSKTIPWGMDNDTSVTLLASASQLAEFIGGTDWRIRVGPIDENTTNSAAEFIFTKIQYMMLMLQSIPGDQIYTARWQISFDLPSSSVLQDQTKLENLNWTVDFGEGTIMQANVTVIAGRVIVDELLNVTEGNITASETYLSAALGTYRMFSINYTYTAPLLQTERVPIEIENDWSKTWSYRIAPGAFTKTINVGPFSVTLEASPTLNVDWFMGWERKWSKGSYRLEWFESWMKITPAIRVDASAGVSVDYTVQREFVLWTFSTRFTFWAGAVLVWANLRLTVSVGVELNANGQFSISTWAQASAWYKAGVRWQNGWTPIWQSGRDASYGKPTITASAGVTITPYTKCRLAFLLYDVGGPFVEAVAYAPINIQVSASQSGVSGTWAISINLKVNVGVTLAGWIKKMLNINEYSRAVADFVLMSWNGTWL